jgi:hypothetical protein
MNKNTLGQVNKKDENVIQTRKKYFKSNFSPCPSSKIAKKINI